MLAGLAAFSPSLWLWGGIDDNLLVAGLAVAFFTLLSSGAISILCSVVTRRLLGAVITAYLAVFLLNTACLALPRTSSVLFLAAWDREVEEEWRFWQEQIDSAVKFLGKDSPALAAVPPPPPPDATQILARMLEPFVLVHLSIFVLCTGTTILIVRNNCLTLGQPLVRGVPVLPERSMASTPSNGEFAAPEAPLPSPRLDKAGVGGPEATRVFSLSKGGGGRRYPTPTQKSPRSRFGSRNLNPAPPIHPCENRAPAHRRRRCGEIPLTLRLWKEKPNKTPPLDDRQSRVTTQLLEPIRDLVLLWKEIYQAAYAGPGPSWHDWRTTLWQPSALLLASVAAASGLLLWNKPELWRSTIATLNVVFKVLTIIAASITAGLLVLAAA